MFKDIFQRFNFSQNCQADIFAMKKNSTEVYPNVFLHNGKSYAVYTCMFRAFIVKGRENRRSLSMCERN